MLGQNPLISVRVGGSLLWKKGVISNWVGTTKIQDGPKKQQNIRPFMNNNIAFRVSLFSITDIRRFSSTFEEKSYGNIQTRWDQVEELPHALSDRPAPDSTRVNGRPLQFAVGVRQATCANLITGAEKQLRCSVK